VSAIAIVTDSTAYIPNDLVRKYGIHVAPQILIWGEETIRDGVDIMPAAFYERLKTATVMPTTSQVTIAYFHELFQKLAAEGKQILAILVSSKLSGTISSAVQAKEMLPQAQIEIVDSLSTAMALGFQVLAAARADEAGKTFAQVADVARSGAAHTGIVIAVETLEFLHRGGRIEPVERIRTKAKARARLLEIVEGRVKGLPNVRVATIHAAAHQEAKELLELAIERMHPVEAIIAEASPVVGNHAGPGTVGLAYCTDL